MFKKTEVDIYAGGSDRPGESLYTIAGYWKNGKWITLRSDKPSGVDSMFVSGSDIYAFGFYNKLENIMTETSSTGYWKNGKWFESKPIDRTYKAIAEGLYVSGDDVYISGYNKKGSDLFIPGYWLNGVWKSFKDLNKENFDILPVIYVLDNDVYIGKGHGYYQNDKVVELPIFEGSKTWARVTSIKVYDEDVYAGGFCVNNLNKTIAGYWKNGIWIPLMPHDSTSSSKVNSIFIYNNDVYAGGYCIKSGSSQFIAGYWKNGVWTALPQLNPEYSTEVFSIVVVEGDVYAAGYSDNDSGTQVAGYWKNGVWVGLSDGENDAEVKSIVVVPRTESSK